MSETERDRKMVEFKAWDKRKADPYYNSRQW
jgi:hypothetical protein